MAKDEVSPHHGRKGKTKDYLDPPSVALFDMKELRKWSLYRAAITEFTATLLFLYVTISTIIGHRHQSDEDDCGGAGVLGIAWSFGGMTFVLVYCNSGISGGHINPAVTFGLFLARKLSVARLFLYIVAQCLGAVCGVALVRAFRSEYYMKYGGGVNELEPGYTKGTGLGAEIIGTFVLVYTIYAARDPKRIARNSNVPVLAPLPIGFAVFMVHLATIPITGTGINPARSFGAAVVYNKRKAWDDQWIFWIGPLIGAAAAAAYHQYVLRAGSFRDLETCKGDDVAVDNTLKVTAQK